MTAPWICTQCSSSNPDETQTCAICGHARPRASIAPTVETATEATESPSIPPLAPLAGEAPAPATSWLATPWKPLPEAGGRFSAGNRTRTWLGLGAGVLAVVFLGIGFWSAARRDDSGSITQAGSINYSELRVGDCFNLRDPTEVTIVDATQCSEPHVHEVFYVGELSPGAYPAVEVIDAFAEAQCTPAFEGYVGHDFMTSVWYPAYIGPSEETFRSGDRVVVCHLFNSTETAVTGSARGSAR